MTFASSFGRVFSPTFQPKSQAAVSGGFAPTDITGLALWLDFSDADTLFTDAGSTKVSADGQAIYQANDKSGNGNHAVQTVEANRPLYKINIKNSRSLASFDGNNDTMVITDKASIQFGTGDFTAIIVWVSSNVARGVVSQNTLLSKNYTGFEFFNYQTKVHSYLGGASNELKGNTVLINNTYYITSFRRLGSTLSSVINGIPDATVTNAANMSNVGTNLYVGWRPDGGRGKNFLGNMGEIILYNSDITESNLMAVVTYLNNKWGVY